MGTVKRYVVGKVITQKAARPVLQAGLRDGHKALAARPLPGIVPLKEADWLTVDDAYAAQLALKAQLLATRPADVLAMLPCAEAAAQEALELVLQLLAARADFDVTGGSVTRPDGVKVTVAPDAPLRTLSRLIQEDICILQKQGEAHVLTGALLCFPASWTLSEKLGRALIGVHRPVAEYDGNIARRVQRLFDGVQVGRPLVRGNYLEYADPSLFHPRTEAAPRADDHRAAAFGRAERQTMIRLPQSRAVIFAIHTSVVRLADF